MVSWACVGGLIWSETWVGLTCILGFPLYVSAWADGNLVEAAGQLGQTVEHPNPGQANLGARADEALACSCWISVLI